MNKLNIILLCTLTLLIGWHLGWQGRGSQDSKDMETEVEQRLNHYLVAGINSGLITINDKVLFPAEETDEPTVPAKDTLGAK